MDHFYTKPSSSSSPTPTSTVRTDPRLIYKELYCIRNENLHRNNSIDLKRVQSLQQQGISYHTYRYLLFSNNARYFTTPSSTVYA